jgi:hypothetical protein
MRAFLVLVVAVLSNAASADELLLRDGEKLSGTVIGYEDGRLTVTVDGDDRVLRITSVKAIKFERTNAPDEQGHPEENPKKSDWKDIGKGFAYRKMSVLRTPTRLVGEMRNNGPSKRGCFFAATIYDKEENIITTSNWAAPEFAAGDIKTFEFLIADDSVMQAAHSVKIEMTVGF